MQWDSEQSATSLVGKPIGRVDEASWEAFHTSAISAVEQAAAANLPLIIDLAGIDYMSSRGLRVLTLIKRDAEPPEAKTLDRLLVVQAEHVVVELVRRRQRGARDGG